ncbi:uncharacterized protein C8Q71DRAFT_728295 [Rhodofomes roseus]|uniref:Uncharacterized protein n=1 Tax=Rhodofomes roseus TaxID=34475 RepID=A0ABQ8JY22_9APHY|nr:uncharacterized protein C8Q71DRAFT_728295 [Rhodofomes roseus]KAH9829081.1 hypothetical protein C8Q71DRAFT_728295 [Rhodofomes roseus]
MSAQGTLFAWHIAGGSPVFASSAGLGTAIFVRRVGWGRAAAKCTEGSHLLADVEMYIAERSARDDSERRMRAMFEEGAQLAREGRGDDGGGNSRLFWTRRRVADEARRRCTWRIAGAGCLSPSEARCLNARPADRADAFARRVCHVTSASLVDALAGCIKERWECPQVRGRRCQEGERGALQVAHVATRNLYLAAGERVTAASGRCRRRGWVIVNVRPIEHNGWEENSQAHTLSDSMRQDVMGQAHSGTDRIVQDSMESGNPYCPVRSFRIWAGRIVLVVAPAGALESQVELRVEFSLLVRNKPGQIRPDWTRNLNTASETPPMQSHLYEGLYRTKIEGPSNVPMRPAQIRKDRTGQYGLVRDHSRSVGIWQDPDRS